MKGIKKKKICFFIPSLGGGGAERATVNLANSLSDHFDVDLVISNGNEGYIEEVNTRVNVIDFNSKKLRYSLFKLIAYLRANKPHSLISVLTSANVLAILARFFSMQQIKLIISERAAIGEALTNNASWQARLNLLFIRFLYGYADKIVTVSMGIAKELVEKFSIKKKKIEVIYNPVVDQSLIEKSLLPLNNPFFDHKKIPMILGIGRLTEQKDFPTLIKAFNLLKDHENAKLVILGEGHLLNSLQSLVKDLSIENHVFFPGFVENPFVWMKNAKLFVLSSAYEGLPNALIQAMACGTQVISTNCPTGPQEILENGKWGDLVPIGDDKALSSAMLKALKRENHINVNERANFFNVTKATNSYIKLINISKENQ